MNALLQLGVGLCLGSKQNYTDHAQPRFPSKNKSYLSKIQNQCTEAAHYTDHASLKNPKIRSFSHPYPPHHVLKPYSLLFRFE